jgi:hypothetical protein
MAADYGIGGAVGGLAGYISAYQGRAAATRSRRRTRKAALAASAQAEAAAKQILSSPEYAAGANFVRTFFGVAPQKPKLPAGTTSANLSPTQDKFNPYAVQPVEESASGAGGGQFLDPLTENFLKAGNVVGEQSGLEGFAPAAAQTAGLAAFKFQQQLNLLPQLFQLGQAPQALRSQYYNQFFGEQSAILGAGQGFGPSPLGTAALGSATGFLGQGGAGGFNQQAGISQDQLSQLLAALQSRQGGNG